MGAPGSVIWTNAGITTILWQMSGFLWIFIQSTAGSIVDSPDVYMQSISFNGKDDALIIVHCYHWIILGIIYFKIVFFAILHYETKEKGKSFKHD